MKHRRAFTIIELLLALMLTSLLTAALSLMISQAAREREAMREPTDEPAWAAQLIDLIEDDLQQAQWWAGAEDRIVLIGLGRNGMPAQIGYQWVMRETGSVLTRRQVSLTDGAVGRDEVDQRVIAIDLHDFAVGPHRFGEQPADDAQPMDNVTLHNERGLQTLVIKGQMVSLQPLPDRVAIELVLQDRSQIGPSREVLLR